MPPTSDLLCTEDRIVGRLILRIMPLIALTYFVSVIDKSNVSFAKLQMIDDLNMSEATFGFGASLFFIAMLTCELPSSLLARRYGLRLWATRIMLSWAVITLLMMLATSPMTFYVLRFLLGVAEAGLYPAILFYLSSWFPQRHKARVTGLLTLGSAFGNGVGAALSGPVLDFDGILGLHGWQWLFLVTGILPLGAGLIVWRWLPSRIDDADFLSAHERACLHAAVQRDAAPAAGAKHFLSVLWDSRVLLLSVVFVVILTALFGVIYWVPTVVKTFNVTGTEVGFLSSIPWALVAIALLTIPPRLKSAQQVTLAMAVISFAGVLLFLASLYAGEPWLRFTCIALGTPCISLLITCFWTIPVRDFSGIQCAAALAVISTYGNLGGFFAQNLMPWAADVAGDPAGAMYVPAACLGVLALGALYVWRIGQARAALPLASGTRDVA